VLLLDKFLSPGKASPVRRLLSPLAGRIATRLDVVLEDLLPEVPLTVVSNEAAAFGGWFRRKITAGMPMVTTSRAERPFSSGVNGLGPVPSPIAKPGRSSCSKKAFSSAGSVPSQSGKNTATCCAAATAACARATSPSAEADQAALSRSNEKSSRVTSITSTSCPAFRAPST
jgi:hypothetical protein